MVYLSTYLLQAVHCGALFASLALGAEAPEYGLRERNVKPMVGQLLPFEDSVSLGRRASGLTNGLFAPSKRQNCPEAFCPDNLLCVPTGSVCCLGTTGYCDSDQVCCENGCIPAGTNCCADGSFCPAGEACVIYESDPNNVFCIADGSGPAPTVVAPPPSQITLHPQTTELPDTIIYTTYTFTYTWYYLSYFYTIIDLASAVTYTTRTTFYTYTVSATAEGAASSSADALFASATATLPADANTELATVAPPTATPSPTPPSVGIPTVTAIPSPPVFTGAASRMDNGLAWAGVAVVAAAFV